MIDAKDEFRAALARVRKFETDLQDPDKVEIIAATPPHLIARG